MGFCVLAQATPPLLAHLHRKQMGRSASGVTGYNHEIFTLVYRNSGTDSRCLASTLTRVAPTASSTVTALS